MNEVMNSVNNVIMDNFHKTDNILNDVQCLHVPLYHTILPY